MAPPPLARSVEMLALRLVATARQAPRLRQPRVPILQVLHPT